jgi:ubiquinone/menaquinone biosynthesis C-methylase UbiE
VWDCACGSGQATLDLATRFNKVLATDASAEQIASAKPHPRVEYSVALAEQSGLESGSVSLVTVAQALHWFNLERFYPETKRVLKPAGVLAAWAYGMNIKATGRNPIQAVANALAKTWPDPHQPRLSRGKFLSGSDIRCKVFSFQPTKQWIAFVAGSLNPPQQLGH